MTREGVVEELNPTEFRLGVNSFTNQYVPEANPASVKVIGNELEAETTLRVSGAESSD